jgi:hypothetical protein
MYLRQVEGLEVGSPKGAARAHVPIVSVPVHVYYPPPQDRVSHYRPFRDTVRIILVVLGLIFRLW